MVRMLLIAVALCVSTTALAQHDARENRRERREDKREIAKDKREIEDDLHDYKALQRLSDEFDEARAHRDGRALRRIDDRLKRHVANELKETNRELRDDRREVARSGRELRDERQEVARDHVTGHHGAEAADRRDLRDDRRDLRDDARDAHKEEAAMNRYVELLREVAMLDGRYDPPGLERKRQILNELIARARGEIREDKKELKEDKRELREDRHETREDRHHR